MSIADAVAHLSLMASMARIFDCKVAAQKRWAKHRAALGEYPTAYVRMTALSADVEGVIVDGDWDASFGWDLDARVVLLTPDGEMISVAGWLADEAELVDPGWAGRRAC